nr:AraC family transcriptional regulator [Mammaliicoccus lentus]
MIVIYITPDWLKQLKKLPDIDDNIKFFGGHKQKVPMDWEIEWEEHHAFEILMICSGVQKTEFQNREYLFKEKDIILIPPGLYHKNYCVSEEGMEYFCVHFDIDYPDLQQKLQLNCPLLLERDNKAYSSIENVLNSYIEILEKEKIDLMDRLIVEKLMLELIIQLIHYADLFSKEISISENNSLLLAKNIAESIQYNFKKFTENPNQNSLYLISLNYISESLNISNSTMLKIFKDIYRMSPKQYLDSLRFNESKYLLRQPYIAISEIAEIVGYSSASHFSRQFKKWSNMSPNQYRNIKKTV